MASYLRELCDEISATIGLTCKVEAEPIELPGETAMYLAIAINELALNAHRHAYHGEEGGCVWLACRRGEDSQLHLTFSDIGGGMPEGFSIDKSGGFGMSVISSMVSQVGGTLHVDNQGGARVMLTVPLA